MADPLTGASPHGCSSRALLVPLVLVLVRLSARACWPRLRDRRHRRRDLVPHRREQGLGHGRPDLSPAGRIPRPSRSGRCLARACCRERPSDHLYAANTRGRSRPRVSVANQFKALTPIEPRCRRATGVTSRAGCVAKHRGVDGGRGRPGRCAARPWPIGSAPGRCHSPPTITPRCSCWSRQGPARRGCCGVPLAGRPAQWRAPVNSLESRNK